MQDIRPRDLIFGCWILFILDREYSLLWNRYLGYWAFTTYDTLVNNIFQMFFNYPMDRKRMKSIWALFRASLPPFPYLRTKNPGSKKCIERSLEGRISLQLRWWTKRKWCISWPQLATRHINTCLQHFELTWVFSFNKGIGDAGSTADIRMLWPWSALVCLGLL